jgi:hypothetical protein
MRFYTTDQLGPNRFLTPEGFLVCKDVPIGRTGDMLYVAGEVPVDAGPDGLIKITRDADSVFHDDTISSFEGKPVTLDHPTVDVNPLNWGQLAKGVVQHVRRGAGTSENLLLANLLITDHAAIEAVRKHGIRQVSSGYDAEYEQIAPGQGRQRNIIGNHVALVEKGRCGERCAIGDKDMSAAAAAKAKKTTTWKDRLRSAFKSRDESELETALSEADAPAEPLAATTGEANTEEDAGSGNSGETSLEAKLDALIARIEALEARGSSTAPTVDESPKKDDDDEEDDDKDDDDDEDGDKRKRAADAQSTRDTAPSSREVQDVFARAEVLAPGIKLPTHDAATTPAKVRDSLCALKRKALTRFYESDRGRAAVLPFTGGNDPDFKAMTCDALSTVFVGASEIAKRENNFDATATRDASSKASKSASAIVEINRKNQEFWSRK